MKDTIRFLDPFACRDEHKCASCDDFADVEVTTDKGGHYFFCTDHYWTDDYWQRRDGGRESGLI